MGEGGREGPGVLERVWHRVRMSNDVAYPVLRTRDAALALSTARRLLAVGDRRHARVCVDAELPTAEDVLRVRSALPDVWFRTENAEEWARFPSDPTGLLSGLPARSLPTDQAGWAGLLPLWASMLDQAVGSVEDAFVDLVGPRVGEIRWHSLAWPGAEEPALAWEGTHAMVTLLLNTRTRELDERADEHTVLVHVRRGNLDGYEERQASWLASRAGLSVIGPAQRP